MSDPNDATQQEGDNPVSSINDEDINFIPIAYPVVDSDQQNIIRPHRRLRRKHPHPLPPIFPPITLEQLRELLTDYDDYFANPLVSHHVFAQDDIMVDELDKIIAGFNEMPPQPIDPMSQFEPPPQPAVSSLATSVVTDPTSIEGVVPSLLRPDVSNQKNVQFPNDPYNVPGKTVKHGDILVESVDIPQNGNWAAGIDYYEEGRLIGFSITCNDSDIVPTVFIESGSSSQTMINNMSFKEMVQHGRGMNYAAAISTINTPNGVVSRDVQGQPSTTFPYVARYKDQYTGDGVYDDVKDTPDDKAYVITYEPSTSIPYQRLSVQVYNGSSLGTRMINKLEIRRVIYVDPEPVAPTSASLSDISKFSAAVNTMASKMGLQLPPMVAQPLASSSNFARSYSVKASSEGGNGNLADKLYDDFIKFLYHQRFGDKDKVSFNRDNNNSDMPTSEQQQTLSNLNDMLDEHRYKPKGITSVGDSGDEQNLMQRHNKTTSVMEMIWE